jgi:hypothetical protein
MCLFIIIHIKIKIEDSSIKIQQNEMWKIKLFLKINNK